jgi:hypothetical protein
MAKKPSITTIASGYYSRNALNTNFENLRDKFDNTLSLDGSTPNAMQADLDMNSNDILNAQTTNTESLRINGVLVTPDSITVAPDATGVNYNVGAVGSQDRTLASRLRDFISVKDFGAVGDGVTDDTAAIQAAENYARDFSGMIFYPSGVYICSDTITWNTGVYRVGQGALPNWRPAPVGGPSTPPELFDYQSGVELRFVGSGSKSFTLDFASEERQCGFFRDNPRKDFDNAFDQEFTLTDFTNADASGTTRATLKPFSVAVYLEPNNLRRGITHGFRIITACDGVSSDGGTNLQGYKATDSNPAYANWDVGLFANSPWGTEFSHLHVIGYWNIKGMLLTSGLPNNPTVGYAEENTFKKCMFQSGVALRNSGYFPILSKTSNSVTVGWTPSHRIETSGTVRIGQSFTQFSSYTYSGLTFDVGTSTLTLTGIADTTDIVAGNGGHAIQYGGGAGFALSAFYDCEFYDFSRTSLTQEPFEGRKYGAALEGSGEPMRAFKFFNCIFHPCGPLVMMLGSAKDWEFYSCYSEPRRWRETLNGPLQDRGGVVVAGANPDFEDLIGSANGGNLSVYGRMWHGSVSLAPLRGVSVTGRYGAYPDAPFFLPRKYISPRDLDAVTSRDIAIWVDRDAEFDVRTRDSSGSLNRVIGATSAGNVLLGRNVPDTGSRVIVGGSNTSYGMRLRGALEFDEGLEDIQNDQNGGLISQDNPTADGLRFLSSLSQLRLRREEGVSLQVHRATSGRLVEFRRDGVLSGTIEVYTSGARYAVTDDGLWHGMPFTTAERPTAPYAGFHGFDTTLGIPVWWDGSNWVNASGSTV